VTETANFPMSGVSLDKAIRQKRTMTCIIVGRRPGNLTLATGSADPVVAAGISIDERR
jgi:hypothetical protein